MLGEVIKVVINRLLRKNSKYKASKPEETGFLRKTRFLAE